MQIVLVDDHPLVLRGLTAILSLDPAIKILGKATNSKEALSLIQTTTPDLAIIDIRLANESGLDLIEEVKQQGSICKFIVLTSSTEERDFKRAKEIGVDGYVLKEALPEELLHALQIISKDRRYYDPGVFELVGSSQERPLEEQSLIEQLTPKEKEVLLELGMGLSNKQISQTLYITEYTVKKHVSQVLAKLGLADRTNAALYAHAKGLVSYQVN